MAFPLGDVECQRAGVAFVPVHSLGYFISHPAPLSLRLSARPRRRGDRIMMLFAAVRCPFHYQPEAQHPKPSAIHKLPADYPIY